MCRQTDWLVVLRCRRDDIVRGSQALVSMNVSVKPGVYLAFNFTKIFMTW